MCQNCVGIGFDFDAYQEPGTRERQASPRIGRRWLYIEATAKGSKLWKMAYRIGPKQKTLSFGSWPAVSIVEARAMREQAKKALAAGEDPGAIKKALKAGAWVRLSTSGPVSSSSSAALRNTNQPHSLRLISSNGAAKRFVDSSAGCLSRTSRFRRSSTPCAQSSARASYTKAPRQRRSSRRSSALRPVPASRS